MSNTTTASAGVVSSTEFDNASAMSSWTRHAADRKEKFTTLDHQNTFFAGWIAHRWSEANKVEMLRKLITNDAHACTFQSLGQYRSALLAALSNTEAQRAAVGGPTGAQSSTTA